MTTDEDVHVPGQLDIDDALDVDLTLAQYAEHTGRHPRTVKRWLAAGQLPTATLTGDGWLIPSNAVPVPAPNVPAPRTRTDLAHRPGPPAPISWPLVVTFEQLHTLMGGPDVITAYALDKLLREDIEIHGMRSGLNRSWLISMAEVIRFAGGAR
jgi:hypothetical protein